jgi:hypothetical protein
MIKKEHILRVLLLLVMAVLFFPLIQETAGLFSEKPLKGAFTTSKKPVAGLEQWWNGTYQDSFELWQNEQFGMRNSYVRLHNQVEFNFFNNASANGIVIGKNNFLYEAQYIRALNGNDYVGEKSVQEITRKLKILQDTLAKRNITLIVGIAPSKASFYSEYIPDDLYKPAQHTNYKSFSALLPASGINCIDFSKWFLSKKETSKCPLFPKTGIHWSRFGSVLAIDSLIKYVEYKRQIDMPSLITKNYFWSDSIRSPDDDIGTAMNLLCPIQPLMMAYQDYNFENPDQKAKIKMMVISDSFFWNMFDIRLAPRSFSAIDFWYYNQQVYHTDGRPIENAADADDCLETEHNDVVFILASEPNLAGLGWGYVDDAYDFFVLKRKDRILNKMVRVYETSIRMDQGWMMTVKAKADARKIPIDSMIHMDAVYLANEKLKK